MKKLILTVVLLGLFSVRAFATEATRDGVTCPDFATAHAFAATVDEAFTAASDLLSLVIENDIELPAQCKIAKGVSSATLQGALYVERCMDFRPNQKWAKCVIYFDVPPQ